MLEQTSTQVRRRLFLEWLKRLGRLPKQLLLSLCMLFLPALVWAQATPIVDVQTELSPTYEGVKASLMDMGIMVMIVAAIVFGLGMLISFAYGRR